jgi:hypothetical protein
MLFVLLLVSLANAGDDDKKKPDKKPPDKMKEIGPPKQIPVLPHVPATVETRDGTIFLGRFRLADTVVIRTPNLGSLTLDLATVRFLDMEGDVHRIATHAPETFYGLIQNESFNVEVLATKTALKIPRAGVKRLVFPDPPPREAMP